MQVIKEAGIEFVVAKIWSKGTRQLEKELKRRKGAGKFCPVCKKLKELEKKNDRRRTR